MDTGHPFVAGGAWHDDQVRRLVILVNHDLERAQGAQLSPTDKVSLEPGQAVNRLVKR